MEPTGARLPELEVHLERQMRTQERQLAVARFFMVAAAVIAILVFRNDLSASSVLLALAGAVVVYNAGIFVLVGRFPPREVGIVATALDMVVVTLAIYAEPDALDAYLFYGPVVLGVALRFGIAASLWASLVVSFMYASVILILTDPGDPVRSLLTARLAYLVGIGLAGGLFASVVIGRANENARLSVRLAVEQRERMAARETELLSQLAREFGSTLERDTTVAAILRAASAVLGDLTWLLLSEPDDAGQPARLVLAGAEGRDPDAVARLRAHLSVRPIRIGEGISGGAAATATAVAFGGDERPAVHPGDPDGVEALNLRAVLAAPIVSRGTVRGVLVSGSIDGPVLGEGERRLAEAIAQRAGPALENASLWADLQEQVRREQLAQRIKDDFLSIVSHELRTPLTSIQGYSQLLEGRLRDAPDSAKAQSQLRVIRSQVTRMRRLVDDLLDVSRIDRRGGVSIEPEPLDLAEEIREAVARTKRQHKERELDVDVPDSIPMSADRDRIGQVLTNLLDNAIKYSPEGGPVSIRATQSGEGVEIRVADTGIGIPSDQLDQVFERFYQVEGDVSARRFGGLGLGLYITRAIVEAHGGEIHAELNRDAGHGTVFCVRLPVRAKPPPLPATDDLPAFVARRSPSGAPR